MLHILVGAFAGGGLPVPVRDDFHLAHRLCRGSLRGKIAEAGAQHYHPHRRRYGYLRRLGHCGSGSGYRGQGQGFKLGKIFPWFILWFVVASIVNTTGVLPLVPRLVHIYNNCPICGHLRCHRSGNSSPMAQNSR